MTEQTIYLWAATQSEPGCDGTVYEATATDQPPAPIKPVTAHPGLVHDWSCYDPWSLIRTCKGELVDMALPGMTGIRTKAGQEWDVAEIVHARRYRKAAA